MEQLTFEQHRALANLGQALKFANGVQRRQMVQQLRQMVEVSATAQVGDLVAALSDPRIRNLPLRFELNGKSVNRSELEDIVLSGDCASLIVNSPKQASHE